MGCKGTCTCVRVKARLRQDQGKVKARSRQGQGKVKARSRQGQGKVKIRSRQCKHNLNRNYNLMGFDTIEINLVIFISTRQGVRVGYHQRVLSGSRISVLSFIL